MIKKYLPKKIKLLLRYFLFFLKLCFYYLYDLLHYIKYSQTFYSPETSCTKLEARITSVYHTIEKGLTFSEIRPGFGYLNIKEIDRLLQVIMKACPDWKSSISYSAAVKSLKEYSAYHDEINYKLSPDIVDIINSYVLYDSSISNKTYISRKKIEASIGKDFITFSNSRHSIRSFDSKPVEIEKIISAIESNRKAPSVCNRQTSKCYIVTDETIKDNILILQKGNRGFSNVDKLIVITSLTSAFYGINEYHQGYIDSGLYSMNLIYNLHFESIATCPLCWCHSPRESKVLTDILNIGEGERVVVIIAIGNYKNEYYVPASNKNHVESYYEII
jgi:hypothetical protein